MVYSHDYGSKMSYCLIKDVHFTSLFASGSNQMCTHIEHVKTNEAQ